MRDKIFNNLPHDLPVGTQVRINLQDETFTTEEPSAPVFPQRYDATTDEMVPVTQEWVQLAQRRLVQIHTELTAAKARIYALEYPNGPVAEPEQDRMWQAVRLAASC